MDSLYIAVCLFVVIISGVTLLCKRNHKRYPPVAGSVIHQLIHFPRVHHYMTELACKYRTYRILDLFKYAVYTADPANVEYVLKTNFANYGKGKYLHSVTSDIFGNAMFTVDGERWQHQRKAGSTQFATKVLRDFSSEIFKTKAIELACRLNEARPCNEAIDIQDLFMKSTLDSIVHLLLGIEIDTMSGTSEENTQFSNAIDELSEVALYRIIDIFWKIKRLINIGREAVIKRNLKVVDQFMYKLISKRIEVVHSSENELSLKKRDFMSRLVESKETADPKYLRDIVFFFIAAGKTTTASALSWFVYMMCKHRQVQERIAQEVREATYMKTFSSADEVAAHLTEEVLSKMHYLHAALTETLRLYPSLPMNGWVCFSDDTLPDGNHVKKGEFVVYQPYSMGRMKFIWGDDAEEFRPERWLDENGLFQGESPFKFTAFGAGPRSCLGKEYAYMQMKIFAAVLLGSYILKMRDENEMVNYKTMFTFQIDGGLYVHGSPRFEHS